MPFRILIADDDLHTRRILETLLAREPSLQGPEIVGAADGEEALAALDRFTPDLVITDLLMPRMDGFELVAALRAPALVSSGGHDTTCPAPTIRSVFDRIQTAKSLFHDPDLTHTTSAAFYSMTWSWLDRFLHP